jgi:putative ABC transport system ATP-binding protein
MLRCAQISKTFQNAGNVERVLDGISLDLARGQSTLLLGPSGSGKTTLLSIVGCLLTPSSGELFINDDRIDFGNKDALVGIRRKQIGFVFQHAQLLAFLTVAENLRLVGMNASLSEEKVSAQISALSRQLHVEACLDKLPSVLSGGQRQRVAIARALMTNPSIVLADEPTAALDWNNAQAAVELLVQECRLRESTVLVVTHDIRLIPLFDRVLTLSEGRLHDD